MGKVVNGYTTVLGTTNGSRYEALDFNEDAGGTDIFLIYTTLESEV